MTREFNVVVERAADGFYVASVPALPGCHTQARSLEELDNRIAEAIELCVEDADMREGWSLTFEPFPCCPVVC